MELSFEHSVLLLLLLGVPLGGAAAMFLPLSVRAARVVAAVAGITAFVVSVRLLELFRPDAAGMQFVERRDWMPSFGISFALGVDGLSIYLLVLTTLLTALVLIASPSVRERVRSYLGLMLVLEVGMLGTFMALDLVTFYLFWELMLIPMYLLIGIWGGERRIYAAFKFVLFTAVGSLLMLVAIVYLGYAHQRQTGESSFFLSDLMRLQLTSREQFWLFLAFALAFAIKIPLFPLHTWLPDAHVEAPTGASVILAGVLLKMGLYGLIRFCVPLFPSSVVEAQPVFAALGVIGIVYGALMAWVQTDIKKLVAYSSVSHLGFCVLGFAALNVEGVQGAVIQMLNHGISTGALFFLVGVLYDRKHTREITDFAGLAAKVPAFSAVFFVFTLSSIGLPSTNGFIGEFLILYGGYKFSGVLTAVAVSGVVLGAVYMLSLYRRVFFGELNADRNGDLSDLVLREKVIFAPLIVLVFVIGLAPSPILRGVEKASLTAIETVRAVSRETAR